ncbi:MAG TPA: hypothetical protein VHZ51_00295 [Ktedonobacteraceae bacterium]|nr:hypothetical protein [Ktedonobacteraceae bacterium]
MTYWKRTTGKYVRVDAYSTAAIGIIVLAAVLRITLIALGWPPLDSDEGTMGVMAMHIAFHGEWPIFFYGQGYMGAFEAYLAAVLFHLFGVSTFTLLLGLVLIYTAFLAVMYRLASALYSKGLALVTLVLLCLGSNPMLTRELVAIGGYPETLLFSTIIMLLSSWLALTSKPQPRDLSRAERRKRLWGYAGWGFVAGLGIWTHVLVLPFVLVGGILVLLFCWREWRSWALICVIVALLIGALPMIIYNIYATPGRDTFSYVLSVHNASGIPASHSQLLWPLQLQGGLLVSLPIATGVTPVCNASQVDFTRLGMPDVLGCTTLNTAWALGIVVLWVLAVILAIGALRQLWPQRSRSPEERTAVIKNTARLALLAGGVITGILYVISPDSALYSVATSRYLIGVLVSMPAVLWPLWRGVQVAKPLVVRPTSGLSIAVRPAPVSMTIRRGILLVIGIVYLIGTLSIFTGFPAAPRLEHPWGRFATQVNDRHLDLATTQALDHQQYALIRDLLRIGSVRIYSDYWTCGRLIFQSQEHIICSVVEVNQANIKTGQTRYLPYWYIVRADPYSSYVFVKGSPEANDFAQYFALPNPKRYKQFVFDGYVIYQPIRHAT